MATTEIDFSYKSPTPIDTADDYILDFYIDPAYVTSDVRYIIAKKRPNSEEYVGLTKSFSQLTEVIIPKGTFQAGEKYLIKILGVVVDDPKNPNNIIPQATLKIKSKSNGLYFINLVVKDITIASGGETTVAANIKFSAK